MDIIIERYAARREREYTYRKNYVMSYAKKGSKNVI